MGNYLEGDLYLTIKNDTPKNILDFLFKADHMFHINKRMSDIIKESKIEELQQYITDDDYLNPFPSITFSPTYTDETIAEKEKAEIDWNNEIFEDSDSVYIDDYSKYDYYFVEISVSCKRNHKRLDQIVESLIAVLKPYRFNEEDEYLGYLEDEDGNFKKEYYYDRSVFNELQESRNYLCNGCKFRHENALCEKYEMCVRAYKLGCENQIKVDFKMENLNDIPSLKEIMENNTEVGN